MKSLPPILASLACVLLLLGAYVGGYLGLGERREYPRTGVGRDANGDLVYRETKTCMDRTYRHPWATVVFLPAAWIESQLRGVEIETRSGN